MITTVAPEEMERMGVARALVEAIIGALDADPELEGFLLH